MYRIAVLFAVLIGSTTVAYSWKEKPDIPVNAPFLNKNPNNPCSTDKIKFGLKKMAAQLAFTKWVALAMESADAREIANLTSGYLHKSVIEPMKIRHYMHVSTKESSFCSAVLTINGKPLVVTGEEGRNHIRYIVKNGQIYIVDYDVQIFDYREYPMIKQSKT